MKFALLLVSMITVAGLCRSQTAPMNGAMDDISTRCGYVEVRTDAFMFWLLYEHDKSFAPNFLTQLDPVPVVVWLQGGPGASSVGYGNFEELGPLHLDLTRRQTSWTGLAHVLFIDNPVGTGYSYVKEGGTFATNIDEVGLDLVELLKGFYAANEDLRNNPLYIFCESYGGKMASVFGREIVKAVEGGTLTANFKGVGLGDAWISPMDSVNTWGPYLYHASLLDKRGLANIQDAADRTQGAVARGEWDRATQLWYATEIAVLAATDNVDFYNILYPHHPTSTTRSLKNSTYFGLRGYVGRSFDQHIAPFAVQTLDQLMNGDFKEYLKIIPADVTWGGQSGNVWDAMTGDFMKPTIDIVDANIADGIKVVVYNGMLDLIVDTPGQELWVAKLQWDKTDEFINMRWKPRYYMNGADTGGFSKEIDNFSFWWVLDAGHMVPTDQGEFMLYLLHDTVTK